MMIAYFCQPEMHDVLNEMKTLVVEDALVSSITKPGLCVNRDYLQNAEALKLSKVKRERKVRPLRDLFQRVLHAEMDCDGLVFLVATVGHHASIVLSKSVAKYEWRKGGKYLDTKRRSGIYDGTNMNCEHGR